MKKFLVLLVLAISMGGCRSVKTLDWEYSAECLNCDAAKIADINFEFPYSSLYYYNCISNCELKNNTDKTIVIESKYFYSIKNEITYLPAIYPTDRNLLRDNQKEVVIPPKSAIFVDLTDPFYANLTNTYFDGGFSDVVGLNSRHKYYKIAKEDIKDYMLDKELSQTKIDNYILNEAQNIYHFSIPYRFLGENTFKYLKVDYKIKNLKIIIK